MSSKEKEWAGRMLAVPPTLPKTILWTDSCRRDRQAIARTRHAARNRRDNRIDARHAERLASRRIEGNAGEVRRDERRAAIELIRDERLIQVRPLGQVVEG